MKIAIIGAGTCGLYLGWKLAERGEQIIIFERKKEIGNEVCSGLFSQRILDFVPQSHKLIKDRKNFAFIHFPKKTIKLTFCRGSKGFFLMSHYRLDRLLVSLAQKAGAKILLGHNISKLPQGFDKVIGCDGANSFVRNKLGLPAPNFRLGIQGFTPLEVTGQEYNDKTIKPLTGFTKEVSKQDFVETWPCKGGFLWRIPRGQEIEYGIIANIHLAPGIFRDFLKRNNIKVERIKAKIIPQGLIFPASNTPNLSNLPNTPNNITLCGDSTGLTKPWSGGGVIWQLTSADILLKNFPDFLKYEKEVKRFFKPKIILSKMAVKTGYFLGFNSPWLMPRSIKIESDFLL